MLTHLRIEAKGWTISEVISALDVVQAMVTPPPPAMRLSNTAIAFQISGTGIAAARHHSVPAVYRVQDQSGEVLERVIDKQTGEPCWVGRRNIVFDGELGPPPTSELLETLEAPRPTAAELDAFSSFTLRQSVTDVAMRPSDGNPGWVVEFGLYRLVGAGMATAQTRQEVFGETLGDAVMGAAAIANAFDAQLHTNRDSARDSADSSGGLRS